MMSSKRIKDGAKRAILGLPAPILKVIAVARRRFEHPGEIEDVIRIFAPDVVVNCDEFRSLSRAVKTDMYKHLITPDEYFLYEFSNKTDEEKHRFVGDIERTLLCSREYNSNPSGLVFMDKMKTYSEFSRFFKRDVIEISSEEDYGKYCGFIDAHHSYMVKPIASSRGDGIRKETAGCNEKERSEAFRKILKMGGCVLEELIIQSDKMAALHPESVNTIRYATYFKEGRQDTLACFVKMGRGSSVVDNGGAGGFLAAVDDESGIISTPGRTEHGEVFDIHPDTGVKIVGYQIPDWDELKKLVSELVKVLPEQRYVGWDLAHSASNGWVLVEGNSGGQFVGPQISMKQGIRPIVESTFGRL